MSNNQTPTPDLTTLDPDTHEPWCGSHDRQGCTCAIEERVEIVRLEAQLAAATERAQIAEDQTQQVLKALAAFGYEEMTLLDALDSALDDHRNVIQLQNKAWRILQRVAVNPDTGRPPVSKNIIELAQMAADSIDRLRAALAQVGQATKRACYAAVDGAR